MEGTMKSLVVDETGALTVRSLPIPSYSEKQALVKTISCGICNGTDAKLIHRTFKGVETETYPILLGHEGVGKVIEVGSEVKGYKVGDVVLLPFVDADPVKYPGLSSAWGAFSEYAVVTDKEAFENPEDIPETAYAQTIVPPDIDPVDAAMIVTLREVLSSIRRFGMQAGDKVVIFGCGPVGQTFIKFMSLLGITELIAFDVVDEKLEDALSLGAKYAFNSAKTDVTKTVRECFPDGADYVLDAVGILDIMNQAMPLIRDTGKICCYGIAPICHHELDWSAAPYNWQLVFQQFPSKYEEGLADEQVITWIHEGKISLKDYISDYFKADDILDAFALLEQRKIPKKGIVVY